MEPGACFPTFLLALSFPILYDQASPAAETPTWRSTVASARIIFHEWLVILSHALPDPFCLRFERAALGPGLYARRGGQAHAGAGRFPGPAGGLRAGDPPTAHHELRRPRPALGDRVPAVSRSSRLD